MSYINPENVTEVWFYHLPFHLYYPCPSPGTLGTRDFPLCVTFLQYMSSMYLHGGRTCYCAVVHIELCLGISYCVPKYALLTSASEAW